MNIRCFTVLYKQRDGGWGAGPGRRRRGPESFGIGIRRRMGSLGVNGLDEIAMVDKDLASFEAMRIGESQSDFVEGIRNKVGTSSPFSNLCDAGVITQESTSASLAALREIQDKLDKVRAAYYYCDVRDTLPAADYYPRNPPPVLTSYTGNISDELKAKLNEETTAFGSYRKQCEQLYTMRYEIVNGGAPVMNGAHEDAIENKGVPNFWLTVMKAKHWLCDEINEHDEEVLKFLKDIKLFKVDELRYLKFEFEFAENPFFKNQVLTKTYNKGVFGTNIEWRGAPLDQYGLVPCEGSRSCRHDAVRCLSFFTYFYDFDYTDYIGIRRDSRIRHGLVDIIPNAISYFIKKTDPKEDDDDQNNQGISDEEGDVYFCGPEYISKFRAQFPWLHEP